MLIPADLTPDEVADARARFSRVVDLHRDNPTVHDDAVGEVCRWQPDDGLPVLVHNARVLRYLATMVEVGAATYAALLAADDSPVDVVALDGQGQPIHAEQLAAVHQSAVDAVTAAARGDRRAQGAAVHGVLCAHGMGGLVALVVQLAALVARESDDLVDQAATALADSGR